MSKGVNDALVVRPPLQREFIVQNWRCTRYTGDVPGEKWLRSGWQVRRANKICKREDDNQGEELKRGGENDREVKLFLECILRQQSNLPGFSGM